MRKILAFIRQACEVRWFYLLGLALAGLYGLGGTVHIANILGYGELPWLESPLSWRVGDIFWGLLDVVALVGMVFRWPIAVPALALAAASQVFVYGLFPDLFALTDDHRVVLRSMVAFNGVALVLLGAGLFWVYRTSLRR